MSTSRSDMLLEVLDKVDGMLGRLILVGAVVNVDEMCGNFIKLNLREWRAVERLKICSRCRCLVSKTNFARTVGLVSIKQVH